MCWYHGWGHGASLHAPLIIRCRRGKKGVCNRISSSLQSWGQPIWTQSPANALRQFAVCMLFFFSLVPSFNAELQVRPLGLWGIICFQTPSLSVTHKHCSYSCILHSGLTVFLHLMAESVQVSWSVVEYISVHKCSSSKYICTDILSILSQVLPIARSPRALCNIFTFGFYMLLCGCAALCELWNYFLPACFCWNKSGRVN